MPNGVLCIMSWYDIGLPSSVPHSFITKWAARIFRERFKQGSRNLTHLSGTIRITNPLFPVGCTAQLNTVQKCVIWIQSAKNRIIRSLFNKESPNVNQTIHADLVYSRTGYDITSYFRSAFIEVRKKTPKMSPPTALGRTSVTRHFSWLNQLVGFLFTTRESLFATELMFKLRTSYFR